MFPFKAHYLIIFALIWSLPTLSLRADVSDAPPPSRFVKTRAIAKTGAVANVNTVGKGGVGNEPDFMKSLKEGVQITQLGCMRAVFAFEEGFAETVEDGVTQAFSDADFRVFPSGVVVEQRIAPSALLKIGKDRHADLVVYVKGDQRLKNMLGRMSLYQTTLTIQIFNPMTEELLVSNSTTEEGDRLVDPLDAQRSSAEKALKSACSETMAKALEKAHKILIYEAQFKGVQSHEHLLQIMEYTAKLKGIYHVRQISYDKDTQKAVIEMMAAPSSEVFWRAYLESLPKRDLLIKGKQSTKIDVNPAAIGQRPASLH